jgi:saccharopine dehydrogenase (NAD+, L-glutamate forming)
MAARTARPRPASQNRPYDVVVFGATGFAGRLTAEYLAQSAPPDCRLAIAGRSAAKLEQVRAGLARPDVAVLHAEVGNESSVRELAESTRVLITTVGPYVLYGDGLVAACAAAGTDYLDLTGEPEFVDTSFVRHHATAQESGARIVHAAGFDSIPHDLGAYFTVQQLPTDVPLTVSGYVRGSMTISGGTFATMLTGASRIRQNVAAVRARRAVEPRNGERVVRAGAGRAGRDPIEGGWALPFPSLDPQIVGRSARALERYGPEFRYTHHVSVPHLHQAGGLALGVTALVGAAQIPPARRALQRRLAPGDGPSPERRARSWFTVTFVGTGGGERVVTRVSGGDPGYGETAKMLGESALCLAYDELPVTAGQVTTAAAMGDALIDRLRKAGIGFDVIG